MWRILPIISLLALAGCQDKVICAAFQSTYILDDSTRNAYYSYVWQLDEVTRAEYLASQNGTEDSTVTAQPQKIDYYSYAGEKVVPWRVRKRTKYGIVKYEPYWIKNYRMRTAPMENVYKPKPPAPAPVPLDYVAAEIDSLTTDSLGVASLDSLSTELVAIEIPEEEEEVSYLYKYDPSDIFNVEQLYYNKYYSEKFIDNRPKPDLEAIQLADSLANAVPDSLQKKGFSFKGLFKRKKNAPDSINTEAIDPEIEDSENE